MNPPAWVCRGFAHIELVEMIVQSADLQNRAVDYLLSVRKTDTEFQKR